MALAGTISIPEFDTKAYCKKMAGMAGGSAMIEETCREAEAMPPYRDYSYSYNKCTWMEFFLRVSFGLNI